ncbi:hypothetical protein ACFB49_18690 [Sphingomonas sp. DBB INV C78]|uniref:hypothetical protein n=1 Tax=Sphingomonas sp. DBB INV C78 TaxID=3349434 RepID=UPI0036D41961
MKIKTIALALAMAVAIPALAHAAEEDCCKGKDGKPAACCEKKPDGTMPACCDKHKGHDQKDGQGKTPEKTPDHSGHTGHEGHN